MTTEGLRLAHAPIVEAVVDINCDLPPGIDLAQLQDRAKGLLRDTYPSAQRQIVQHQEFRAGAEEPKTVSMSQRVGLLRFRSTDEKQLVQIRAEGYSFHRLAPYGSLDEYLPEVERTWGIFRDLTRPVQIRSIVLRYINRILLPVTDGRLPLGEYLRVLPHVEDSDLTFTGFVNQHSATDIATGHRVNITLVMEPAKEDRLPIILDIEAVDPQSRSPEEWERVREAILSLRGLKNRVFERTLTPTCLNLFRQQSPATR